jgi:hypothetical protein
MPIAMSGEDVRRLDQVQFVFLILDLYVSVSTSNSSSQCIIKCFLQADRAPFRISAATMLVICIAICSLLKHPGLPFSLLFCEPFVSRFVGLTGGCINTRAPMALPPAIQSSIVFILTLHEVGEV